MLQAPEGYAPDPVDTWSLGITTLELCMGYAPYVFEFATSLKLSLNIFVCFIDNIPVCIPLFCSYAHVSSVRKVFQRTIHDDPPTLATYKEFEFEDRRPRAFSVRLQVRKLIICLFDITSTSYKFRRQSDRRFLRLGFAFL